MKSANFTVQDVQTSINMLTLPSSVDDLTSKIASAATISRRQSDQQSEPLIWEVDQGVACLECHSCPGFSTHSWRKTCQACKCPRTNHAVYQEQMTSVRERIGFKPLDSGSGSSGLQALDAKQMGYVWVPPGLQSSAKIQNYFSNFPPDKVPKTNSSGEQYRNKMLTFQLPKQDLSRQYCKHVDAENVASYEDFIAARNEIALDIGYVKDVPKNLQTVCNRCTKTLQPSDVAVFAPKLRNQMTFHPACFTCETCQEPLVDLTYCVYDDLVYCERHYAEILKPRCNACDEEAPRERTPPREPESVSTSDLEPPVERRKRELRMTPEEEADRTVLELDVADQNDPELQEMVDYVKKLGGAGDDDVIEYYWKPNRGSERPREGSLSSWESGNDITGIPAPRHKSASIAYDSAKYGRKMSLAESIIIPKSLRGSYDDDQLVALEKEAEEYKHFWNVEIPEPRPLADSRTKRVSSRRHSVAYESPRFSRMGRRRTSLAETMIIPKSVQEGYDFATFVKMEQEGEEYNRMWGLGVEVDGPKIEEEDENVSENVSEKNEKPEEKKEEEAKPEEKKEDDDILTEEPPMPPSRARQSRRRSSLADGLIIPRSSKTGYDFGTFVKMEQEGEEYNRIWGLNLPTMTEEEVNEVSCEKPRSRLNIRRASAQTEDFQGPTKRRSKSHSISMGLLSRRRLFSNRRPSLADAAIIPRTVEEDLDEATLTALNNEAIAYQMAFPELEISVPEAEQPSEAPLIVEPPPVPESHHLAPIRESSRSPSPSPSRTLSPHKIDYNEWYHKFSDQTSSHLETTFSDDEDEEVARATAGPPPDVKSHIFYSFPQRSQSPVPPDAFPRAPSRPTTPADYADYMLKFPDQLSPEVSLDPGRRSPASLETYLREMESPRLMSPTATTRPAAPPATLEVYLERMRSQSPSPMPTHDY